MAAEVTHGFKRLYIEESELSPQCL